MANRDFKKIKRVMKDFSQNLSGGSSGGGMILVTELPEVGKEDTLYKTPDGKIWSCINTTEEKEILDLEVGKSFKLKDKILAGDIFNFDKEFQSTSTAFVIEADSETSKFKVLVINKSSSNHSLLYSETEGETEPKDAIYNVLNSETTDLVSVELFNFTEIPSVEITQLLVDNLANSSKNLADIAFLFVNGSHTEEVTTSTWSKVGGSSEESASSLGNNWLLPSHYLVSRIEKLMNKSPEIVFDLVGFMQKFMSEINDTPTSSLTPFPVDIFSIKSDNEGGRIDSDYDSYSLVLKTVGKREPYTLKIVSRYMDAETTISEVTISGEDLDQGIIPTVNKYIDSLVNENVKSELMDWLIDCITAQAGTGAEGNPRNTWFSSYFTIKGTTIENLYTINDILKLFINETI